MLCAFYKTGNISSAEFKGEAISNSEGAKLKASKTYIDLNKKVLISDSAVLAAAAADLIGAEYSYGEKIIALGE